MKKDFDLISSQIPPSSIESYDLLTERIKVLNELLDRYNQFGKIISLTIDNKDLNDKLKATITAVCDNIIEVAKSGGVFNIANFPMKK